MKLKLKPLNEQVMVITGASSGIGLATARKAAAKGAQLVLAARSEADLRALVEEISAEGGRAVHVTADVGSEEDVRRIADEALRAFGRFDTWVNNSGASIYGRALEVSLDDMRRVFDTNFWGVVHGSRVALQHLRHHGGALINIGSETSDKAIPLQAIYSASKHAVKGWTDALRIELEDEGIPVAITLIKPGPIDTPYPHHAKNYLPDEPKHAPPVYHPDSVARAILHAATTPVRELYVGSSAKLIATMEKVSPRLADRFVRKTVVPGTHSGRPPRSQDALHRPGGGLQERGDYPGLVRRSMYTEAALHPGVAGAIALGAGMMLASMWRSSVRNSRRHDDWSPPLAQTSRTETVAEMYVSER